MVKTRWALLLLAMVIAAIAIGSMRDDSATADEGAHIAAGLIKVRDGQLGFYKTQAPLAEAFIAAPLAIAGYKVPEEWRRYGNRPWLAGYILLYRGGHDPQRILRIGRLPVIAMLLALCFAVFFYVQSATGNDVAALAAFALTGFCPNLLAHGRLATVDMALTLFAFASVACLVRLLREPRTALAIVTGIALACALASKISGALLVPFLIVVVLLSRNRPWRHLAIAAAAALVAFCAIYMTLGRSLDLLLPFREYLAEVRAVRGFYAERHGLPQFLLGRFSRDGRPHYYLVAIAVKTTIPALLLFFAIRLRRFESVVCVLFAGTFLLVSSFSSLNLGLRHVLPIYPFLYAAVAISLAETGRRMRIFGAALVAAHALTALLAYPSFLSYFNPLIGSPRNADRVLIDSNLDWGQDLRRLAQWTRTNGIPSIRVQYFGAGNVEHEFGSLAQRWSPAHGPIPRGFFAVSRHFYRLQAAQYEKALANARYVTTIGGSIDVYLVR
jgi:hypothetical protein